MSHPVTARPLVYQTNLTLMQAWNTVLELRDDEGPLDELMAEDYATARYDLTIAQGKKPGTWKVVLWVDGDDEDARHEAWEQAAEDRWTDMRIMEALGK